MTYLWLQILFSLLAAAMIGGLVAYWWIKRRYEDVTETFEQTLRQSQASPSGLTREDLNASLTSLKSSVATIQMPDIKPLHARLGVIENRLAEPVTEVRGLNQRMNDIDGALAMLKLSISELRNTDLEPIERRLNSLSDRVDANKIPDLVPISNRLQHIEEALGALQTSQVDLGPIHSGLAQLEMAITGLNLPETDMQPVRNDIAGLEARMSDVQTRLSEAAPVQSDAFMAEIASLHTSLASLTASTDTDAPDKVDALSAEIAGLQASLAALGASIQTPDLNPLHSQISELERNIERLATDPADFGLIAQRLDILRSEVNAPDQSVDELRARLASIESVVAGIDLGGLYSRMDTLDAGLSAVLANLQAGPDMGGVEQRLMGLQDALRSMPEPDLSPVINSVHAIEGRLDLGALENRMTSIEYGLAALHHALRTRSESTDAVTLRQQQARPPVADVPTPPPAPIWDTPAPPPKTDWEYTTRRARDYEQNERSDGGTRPERETREPRPPREPRVSRGNYASSSSGQYSGLRDTLSSARRPGDQANLLTNAAFGTADDLERISGVGPMLHDLLRGIGVYYFWQVAEWGPREIEWVDGMLDGFNGRIERDNWVGQARIFAAEPKTANRP